MPFSRGAVIRICYLLFVINAERLVPGHAAALGRGPSARTQISKMFVNHQIHVTFWGERLSNTTGYSLVSAAANGPR